MTSLHQTVRRTIARHALCPPGTRVLVALSGGADSVALARLLCELGPSGQFEVAAVAHFNHGLRRSAARDEAFCRDVAAALAVPMCVESGDVAACARVERLSVEAAARRLRYEFLRRAADRQGAVRIAVGHTQDDQAETFLMKLMRGAGAAGLGAIYPRRGALVRPLLDVSRAQIEHYLRSGGHSWVEDETNRDLDNPRNRIRHVVLPELDRAYGGPTRPSLARAAALVREDGQWLDVVGAERFAALALPVADGLTLDAGALSLEPLPIRRRMVLRALRTLASGREVGFGHVESALAVAEGACRAADVPGGRVELRAGKLVLTGMALVPNPCDSGTD